MRKALVTRCRALSFRAMALQSRWVMWAMLARFEVLAPANSLRGGSGIVSMDGIQDAAGGR